ncbi:MAG: hypothetical protein PVSMB8_15470 [Vulcanimicrobiaceae bacterium]
MTTANGTSTALAKKGSAAVAMTGDKVTEKTLNDAVNEVHRLRLVGAASVWAMGRQIGIIHAGQLWKLRTAEDGKAKFRSFDSFCLAELGMTPQNALSTASVAERFSEADVAKWGTSKFALILEAPKSAQPALEKKVKDGAAKREIEAEVRKANKREAEKEGGKSKTKETRTAKNADAKPTQRKTMPKGGKKAKVEEKITVANIVGKSTVPFYKAETFRKPEDERTKARKLGDKPVAEETGLNGVVRVYRIRELTASGHLVLDIETKRVAAEE